MFKVPSTTIQEAYNYLIIFVIKVLSA